jgi:glycosyl transferase family 87
VAAPSTAVTSGSPARPWGAGLASRRFRTALLVLAGVPIGLAYIWYGIVWPLLSEQTNDFRQVYMAGADALAAGADPYQCTAGVCAGHLQGYLGAWGSAYPPFYPPFPLWLLEPFTGLDHRLVDGVALLVASALLAFFIWVMLRTLEVRDWQFGALAVLLSISFAPTLTEVQNRNFQILVLALSAVALAAWLRGDRWWGGAALGFGLAIKLVQAPLLLLSLWGRRWRTVAAAVITWAVLWAVGAPRYLPEYLFQVLPAVGKGTGEEMNVAPMAALARLLHPGSLYKQGTGVDAVVLALTALAAVAVVVLTLRRLGSPRPDRGGRALEMAAAFAASPLLLTVVWAGQLVLLLVPIIVLLDFGLRRGSRGLVVAVAVAWLLIGPAYLAFTNAFAAGFGFPLLFDLWSDSAMAGVVVLWLASLHALRVAQPSTRPAHAPLPSPPPDGGREIA